MLCPSPCGLKSAHPLRFPPLADGGLFAFLWRLSSSLSRLLSDPSPLLSRAWSCAALAAAAPSPWSPHAPAGPWSLALAEGGRGRLCVVVANRLEGSDGFAVPWQIKEP